MIRYIADLRGINVGGNRKILMADLRSLISELGFTNISTYIQSGNIIFNSVSKNINDIQNEIEKAIADRFGFDVPVIVRTESQLLEIIERNPFISDDGTAINNLYFTFLKEQPLKEDMEVMNALTFHPDEFKIIDNNIYLNFSGSSRDSKLSNNLFEKKLKVSATTRNWRTILKLSQLC